MSLFQRFLVLILSGAMTLPLSGIALADWIPRFQVVSPVVEFNRQALAVPLASTPRALPSLGTLYNESDFDTRDSLAQREPVHISPLDPAADVAEWREVQIHYERFLKHYGLNPEHGVRRISGHQLNGAPPVHLLMSYPRHFTVPWSINAHMKPQSERVQRVRAAEQWEHLVQTLLSLGAEIDLIDQDPALADMVFTANGGVADGRRFNPPHFANVERQPETPLFENYFRAIGYEIHDVTAGSLWEGEGDTLVHVDETLGITRFGGFGEQSRGFRSNIGAQQAVADYLGQRFVGLELTDPRFYHLDTCFFPLGDGRSALYYPGAFTEDSIRLIRETVSNPIPISEEDAVHFACNGIVIGHTVVMNRASEALKDALRQIGFDVAETSTTEFLKSGGSVKCLVLLLSGPLRSHPSRLAISHAIRDWYGFRALSISPDGQPLPDLGRCILGRSS